MYKEVFKRMVPVFIGSAIGVIIVALALILFGLADTRLAVRVAVITFVVWTAMQFYFKRRDVIQEHSAEFFVVTPLPIVYAGKKKLYSLPYLDLNLKDKVWGIEVQGTFYALLNAREGNNPLLYRCEAQKILEQPQKPIALRLPSNKELYFARRNRMKFRATATVLGQFGVKAEDWFDDKYLCIEDLAGYNSEDSELDDICAMSMNPDDSSDIYAIEFIGYHVRFAAD